MPGNEKRKKVEKNSINQRNLKKIVVECYAGVTEILIQVFVG